MNSAANLMGLSFRLLLVALVDVVDDLVDVSRVVGRLVHVEVPVDALVQARLDVLGLVTEAQEQAGAIFDLAAVHRAASLARGGGAFRLLVPDEHGRYLTRSAVDE